MTEIALTLDQIRNLFYEECDKAHAAFREDGTPRYRDSEVIIGALAASSFMLSRYELRALTEEFNSPLSQPHAKKMIAAIEFLRAYGLAIVDCDEMITRDGELDNAKARIKKMEFEINHLNERLYRARVGA